MVRFVLRFLAFFLLAAACVIGVGDVARSLAVSQWRLMGLDAAATLVGEHMPVGLPELQGTGADILAWIWAQIAHWPAAPSLGILALLIFGATAQELRRGRVAAMRR
ncbi:hypothetical protein [Aureimonas frigidaquae]|uniref:hypothetical protein n=1 Tax=Aureimonas frigidaquae TaxID=424757 RepID=UPI0007864D74|nr:hypothetical protein [Aureimonas frigidaquae]